MLLSNLRRSCADLVDELLDDDYAEDEIANMCYNIMIHLSFLNMLLIGALTCGMINAVICSVWWLVVIFSIGYLPTIYLTSIVLYAKFMLDYINVYRKR